jgi:hypothetical protein
MNNRKSNHPGDETDAQIRALIAERNRPMARWRPGPAPERPHTPTTDRTAP